MRIDTGDLDLPNFVIPEPVVDVNGLPSPLIDTAWGFDICSRRLIARKAYEDGE